MTKPKKKRPGGNSVSSSPDLSDIRIKLAPDLAKLIASGKAHLHVVKHEGKLVLEIYRAIDKFLSHEEAEVPSPKAGPATDAGGGGVSSSKTYVTQVTSPYDPKPSVTKVGEKGPNSRKAKGPSPAESKRTALDRRLTRIGRRLPGMTLEECCEALPKDLREVIHLNSKDFKEYALSNHLHGYEEAVSRRSGGPIGDSEDVPSRKTGPSLCPVSEEPEKTESPDSHQSEEEKVHGKDVQEEDQTKEVEECSREHKSVSFEDSSSEGKSASQQNFTQVPHKKRPAKRNSGDPVRDPRVLLPGRGGRIPGRRKTTGRGK
jgi:hypothetical protein